MKEAESHVCSIGKSCLHLSTHDKEEFYSHLGYERGPVVSPMKKCMRKLDNLQVSMYTRTPQWGTLWGPVRVYPD